MTYPVPMRAIPFGTVARLSAPDADLEERNAIAQNIFNEYGLAGLMSLWTLQGYHDPEEFVEHGMTHATRWWLESNNPFAHLVRQQTMAIDRLDATIDWLGVVLRRPDTDEDVAPGWTVHENKLYLPEHFQEHSSSSANTLRQVARSFFPQFPPLMEPTCSLYHELFDWDDGLGDPVVYVVYFNTLEAFSDNEAAMQYLACTLPESAAEHFPAPWKAFRSTKNEQWRMYESMGLSLEESYRMACQEITVDRLELPENAMDNESI